MDEFREQDGIDTQAHGDDVYDDAGTTEASVTEEEPQENPEEKQSGFVEELIIDLDDPKEKSRKKGMFDGSEEYDEDRFYTEPRRTHKGFFKGEAYQTEYTFDFSNIEIDKLKKENFPQRPNVKSMDIEDLYHLYVDMFDKRDTEQKKKEDQEKKATLESVKNGEEQKPTIFMMVEEPDEEKRKEHVLIEHALQLERTEEPSDQILMDLSEQRRAEAFDHESSSKEQSGFVESFDEEDSLQEREKAERPLSEDKGSDTLQRRGKTLRSFFRKSKNRSQITDDPSEGMEASEAEIETTPLKDAHPDEEAAEAKVPTAKLEELRNEDIEQSKPAESSDNATKAGKSDSKEEQKPVDIGDDSIPAIPMSFIRMNQRKNERMDEESSDGDEKRIEPDHDETQTVESEKTSSVSVTELPDEATGSEVLPMLGLSSDPNPNIRSAEPENTESDGIPDEIAAADEVEEMMPAPSLFAPEDMDAADPDDIEDATSSSQGEEFEGDLETEDEVSTTSPKKKETKRYHIRYDNVLKALVVLILFILLISFIVSSCSRTEKTLNAVYPVTEEQKKVLPLGVSPVQLLSMSRQQLNQDLGNPYRKGTDTGSNSEYDIYQLEDFGMKNNTTFFYSTENIVNEIVAVFKKGSSPKVEEQLVSLFGSPSSTDQNNGKMWLNDGVHYRLNENQNGETELNMQMAVYDNKSNLKFEKTPILIAESTNLNIVGGAEHDKVELIGTKEADALSYQNFYLVMTDGSRDTTQTIRTAAFNEQNDGGIPLEFSVAESTNNNNQKIYTARAVTEKNDQKYYHYFSLTARRINATYSRAEDRGTASSESETARRESQRESRR